MASSAQRVRLETDSNIYDNGYCAAYVRSVGLFEYVPGTSVRVINTYGTGIPPKTKLYSYSCTPTVGEWWGRVYVDANYSLYGYIGGVLVQSEAVSGKVTVGCDNHGNRV